MKRIEEIDKEKIQALHLYMQLEKNKIYKTKKARYHEIGKRLKKSQNTICSWIRRYYESYKKYIAELIEKENANISNFEGLTEMQSAYVSFRMNGFSTDEAKEKAGYSETTKAADIEKNPAVANKMKQLREKLFEDTKLGAEAIINQLQEVIELGKNGVEIRETQYHDESNQTLGRITSKTVKSKKAYNLSAAVTAAREINSMLGYYYTEDDESKKLDEEDIIVSDDDLE